MAAGSQPPCKTIHKPSLFRLESQRLSVTVAFRELCLNVEAVVGEPGLPTLINACSNAVQGAQVLLGLAASRKRTVPVLHSASGCLKPGSLTLLLGAPGSGKSVLLKSLAGKETGASKVHGDIRYNDHSLGELNVPRIATFVGQNSHIGEMTCREVLRFSGRCQHPEQRHTSGQRADSPSCSDVEQGSRHCGLDECSQQVDLMLAALGLEVCADTPVGTPLLRGISGGQKQRLSLGEMLMGKQSVFLLDEVTNGLDASTAVQVVKLLQSLAHSQGATVLCALLQPDPEVLSLFDDLMLLASGHIVYHGPVGEALSFFHDLGFACPPRKDLASFLQEVTSVSGQRQFWDRRRQGYSYVPASKFAAALQRRQATLDWIQQQDFLATDEEWIQPPLQCQASLTDLPRRQVRFALPAWNSFKVCWAREAALTRKNWILELSRLGHSLAMAVLAGTLYLRSRLRADGILEEGELYQGVSFFSVMHVLFDGITEMTLMMLRIPVFYRQFSDGMYPAWAFLLPSILFRVPYSLLKALVFSAIVTGLTGLMIDTGRYLVYALIMFLTHCMGLALFRVAGACGTSEVVAGSVGAGFSLLIMMLGGFILAKDSIPIWWRWGYFASPLTYAWNALMVTEFSSGKWQQVVAAGLTAEQLLLGERQTPTATIWRWIGIGAVAGFTLLAYAIVWWGHIKLKPRITVAKTLTTAELANAEFAAFGHKIGLLPGTRRIDSPAAVEMPQRAGRVPPTAAATWTLKTYGHREELNNLPAMFSVTANASATPAGHLPPLAKTGFSTATCKQALVPPFTPVLLAFKNINFYVPAPKAKSRGEELQLLSNVSGAFRPGVLWALMGVSGAGKTTLLNVLAGKKTGGRTTGEIWVGGRPRDQATAVRISGYVQQTDVLSAYATVQETLTFSARMRLPADVSFAELGAFVEETMGLMELAGCRGALVGGGAGQLLAATRKKVAIAAELVANPSILFLDEPTSGMDAQAAGAVIRAIRSACRSGRTVVCTIHQPSQDSFQAFDQLMLMRQRGQIVYNGPVGRAARELRSYFGAVPGVRGLPVDANPATWVLQITSQAEEERLGVDFAAIYAASQAHREMEATIDRLSEPDNLGNAPAPEPAHAQSAVCQFWHIFVRNLRSYQRISCYAGVRIVATFLIAALLGSVFWQVAAHRRTSQDIANVLGALYIATTFVGVVNSLSVQPFASAERLVFYQEHAAGMYGVLPFALAQAAAELPYLLAQNCLYCFTLFWMAGFDGTLENVAMFFIVNQLTLIYFCVFGLMCVYLTPNAGLASVCGNLLYSMWHLFSGFLIAKPQMPPWFRWFTLVNPMAWSLNGLISSQYGRVVTPIQTLSYGTISVAQYIEVQYGYHYSFLGYVPLILTGFCAGFALVAVVALKILRFQR